MYENTQTNLKPGNKLWIAPTLGSATKTSLHGVESNYVPYALPSKIFSMIFLAKKSKYKILREQLNLYWGVYFRNY